MYDSRMQAAKDAVLKTPIPFGKYYLLDRINVGGMAEVFQAKAFGLEGFERIVAVKRILASIAEDKEFISMFIDEAKIAVQLNHPNICQVFDLGKVADAYFIAMEYVSGRDVRDIFDRCKQRLPDGAPIMPIAQSCFLVMKVCEGLDHAHSKKDALGNDLNLVHRDVSPQNILISYEGEVKLIDFGIAKAAGKGTITQAGILKGKFGYMSPEQVRGGELDRRSDIFSVGIVLYELLTGERLFVGESDFSTLEKVRNVEIVPPTTYNRKIPEELERIVLKALGREPEDRYPNAIDLHDDLQAFMYTSGEFYSRKELASWMKRIFRAEMEEERAALDAVRDFKPDAVSANHDLRLRGPGPVKDKSAEEKQPSSWTPERPRPSGTTPPPLPPPPGADFGKKPPTKKEPAEPARGVAPAATPAPRPGNDGESDEDGDEDGGIMTAVDALAGKIANFQWDEEELETHVYPAGQTEAEASAAHKEELRDEQRGEETREEEDAKAPSPVTMKIAAPERPAEREPGRQRAPVPVKSADGPIRTGAPRRAIPPAAILGAVALVVLLAIVGYSMLSPRTGELVLVTEPSDGVTVLINQKRVDVTRTPDKRRLAPGSYLVSVQHEGYQPWTETLLVRSGETAIANARLEPLAVKTGGFTIFSDPPGARALLDGQELGQVTPMKVQSVLPGVHTLELRLGDRVWRQQVTLDAGKVLPIQATLPPAPVAARPPPAPTERPAEQPSPPRQASAPPREREPRRPAESPEPSEPSQKPTKRAATSGYLRINSKPWTKIVVDGSETGLNTPQVSMKLPPGEHKITLHNPQFNIRETFSVTVQAGETVTVIKDLLSKE